MSKRTRQVWRKALLKNSSGATLVEVVIAVVVLALITASIPPVLVLITHSQFSWTEQRVAESLTRNVVEYVKVAEYIPGNGTQPLPEYIDEEQEGKLVPDETYDIDVGAQPIDPEDPERAPLDPALGVYDKGVQEITVSIYHVDRLVLQTKNYKVDRLDVLAL